MANSESDRTSKIYSKCLNGNEWSRYPAKEDVDIACYDINDVGGITFCQSGVIFSDNSVALDISGTVIFDRPPQTTVAPTLGDDLVNKTYVDSLISSEVSLWAEEPAVTDVDMSCNDLTRVGGITFCDGLSSITTGTTSFDISSGNTIKLITSGTNNVEVYPGTSGGLHIYSQNSNPPSNPELKIENTNGNTVGGELRFYKNSTTPSNTDDLGTITMYGNNSLNVTQKFCEIIGSSTNITAGSEQGRIDFRIRDGASLIDPLRVRGRGIQPTGIYDLTDSLGLPGNVLSSAGSLVRWQTFTLPVTGMTATGGGAANTYVSGGVRYTAHIFTSSGTFTINNLGSDPLPTLDILMVGSGGSGGGSNVAGINGGGGGAGSVMIFLDIPLIPSSSSASYIFPVTVGIGGTRVTSGRGGTGTNSVVEFPTTLAITHTPTSASTALSIVCPCGGGGGGSGALTGGDGSLGYTNFIAGAGTTNISIRGGGGGGASGTAGPLTGGSSTFFTNQGFGDVQGLSLTGGARNGGVGSITPTHAGAGGGGARGIGFTAGTANVSTITECTPGGGGLRFNLDATSRFIGGGGQGAGTSRPATTSAIGTTYGGGSGYASTGPLLDTSGAANTGGGGGGSAASQISGAGGSGLVIFRYRS
jgi:hypothetical protein